MIVIGIIPARYASTRFPGKPLAPIAGVPMIQRVYERTCKASCVTRTVVATDDQRIVDTVTGFGGEAVMTSEKCRSGTDRVADTARILGLSEDDIVVNIQGDQPLIAPETVYGTAAPLLEETGFEMSTAAFPIVDEQEKTNPNNVKTVFDANGFALYFSRSPIPFARDEGTRFEMFKHIGIYAYTKHFLDIFTSLPTGILENVEKLEQLRALEHGYRIRVVVTQHDSPEVDVPRDIAKIEAALDSKKP